MDAAQLTSKSDLEPSDLLLIRDSYRRYMDTLFQINSDLHFWNTFLKGKIEEIISQDINPDRRAFESGFYVYDIPYNSQQGWLKSLNLELEKSMNDLPEWFKEFFGRTANLYVSKAYNEMELVFLEVIHRIYFPEIIDDTRERSYYNRIDGAIKKHLKGSGIDIDTKNNRFIIEFLKSKNGDFSTFLNMHPRINYNDTWRDFFEFVSILRNAATHIRSVFSKDGMNGLKGQFQEFLDAFITIIDLKDGYFSLVPKDNDNLWSLMNDFTANSIKILVGENNLNFLR
jgi:hypothetical protein